MLTSTISDILSRLDLRKPPVPDFVDTVTHVALEDAVQSGENPMVAFQTRDADGSVAQVLYPSRTRHNRFEAEAHVYCMIYEELNVAMRYIEFHGSVRALYGPGLALWNVDIGGLRHDDLVKEAVVDAKAAMHALRNPIEYTGEEPLTDAPAPAGLQLMNRASAIQEQLSEPMAEPVLTEESTSVAADEAPGEQDFPDQVLYRIRGYYQGSGYQRYHNTDRTFFGKMAFRVGVQRQHDSKLVDVWGADLARVISENRVALGDLIEMTKYPKTKVHVGGQTVLKNIWVCKILERAAI